MTAPPSSPSPGSQRTPPPGPKRPLGLETAARVLCRVESGAYATLALSGELERGRLDERSRALCTELSYGSLRVQPRLDRALAACGVRRLAELDELTRALLRLGAYQLLFMRTPPPLVVSQVVGLVSERRGRGLGGLANAVLRRLAREGEPAAPPLPDEAAQLDEQVRACVERFGLPELFVRDTLEQEGRAEALRCFESLEQPAPVWLRLNPLRGSPDTALAALAQQGIEVAGSDLGECCPEAVRVVRGYPFRGPGYAAGLYTGQDLGAQLVARLVVAPPLALPEGPILDACTGVGGKATHLAALFGNRRAIDAADRSARKLELCREHVQRLGCSSVRTLEADLASTRPGGPLQDGYAAVLLDAPCSGVGVLRRHPEARQRLALAPQSVDELVALQRRLLDALAPRVVPGGVLVYSVCSTLAREGPEQLAGFLSRHPEFTPLAPRDFGDAATKRSLIREGDGALRTLPHRHGADGFFAARLLRLAQ